MNGMSPRQRKWGKIVIMGGIAAYWTYFVIFDIALYRSSNSYDIAGYVTIGFLGLIGAVSIWHQLTSDRKKHLESRRTSTPETKTTLPSQAASSAGEEEGAAEAHSPEEGDDRPNQRETIWFGIPRLGRISFLAFFTFGCGTDLWAAYLAVIYALSLTGVQALRAFNDYVESGGSAPIDMPNLYSLILLMGYITAFVVGWYIWEKKHSVG